MKLSNNKLILIVLSVLCVLMIGATTIRDEWLMPVRTAVGYFLMPVQSGVNRVGKSLYTNFRDHEKLKTALEDNKRLEEELSALTMENTRLLSDSYELKRLRALYDLNQQYGQYRMTGARVIAKDTGGWFHVFRIDKGSSDGVRVDMNVMADGGLVGIVTDVGANYATVRSIIDDVSRVSAMAVQSGDTCIVSGDLQLYADGMLKLSDITDTADIREGDRIVTSTVSAKYLPGLLIGYVKNLKTDPARLTRSGTLIPAADFGTLQEVLVVMDLKAEMSEHMDIPETEAAAQDSSDAEEPKSIIRSIEQTGAAAEGSTEQNSEAEVSIESLPAETQAAQ